MTFRVLRRIIGRSLHAEQGKHNKELDDDSIMKNDCIAKFVKPKKASVVAYESVLIILLVVIPLEGSFY